MLPAQNCTGECLFESFKLEYQITSLEYVIGKSLIVEAVCYNPFNQHDKEAILKYSTTNLKSSDRKLELVLLMVNNFIDNLKLDKTKVRKLVIRNKEIFYILG
jgi:hypothetical protein